MSVKVMMSSRNGGGGGPEVSGNMHVKSLIGSAEINGGDQRDLVEGKKEKKRNVNDTSNSSCSSSIGKNSDVSGKSMEDSGATEEEEEVQSRFKGPLHAMEALEEVLPIRRGISSFYNGKSKSYASLADASSFSSIKEIAKPENAYMRRRRNLLACTITWDKNRNSSLRTNACGGISKRTTYNSNGRAGAIAFALTMAKESLNDTNIHGIASPILGSRLNPLYEDSTLQGSSLSSSLSPRCRNMLPWRSFSLADLQQHGSIQTSCTTPSRIDLNPS